MKGQNISIRARLIMVLAFSIAVIILMFLVGVHSIEHLGGDIAVYQEACDEAGVVVELEWESMGWVKRAEMFLIIFMLIGVTLATTAAILLVCNIKGCLKKLANIANKLAVGDTDVEFSSLGKNEFGVIMDDFQKVASAIKSSADLAEQIAGGNLTVEVEPLSENDTLANALKTLVDDNNDVLSTIKTASLEVNTGAEQVAAASQSLAQGSTEQASAIEEVTESIEGIAAKTKENAVQANEANELVHVASKDAKDGSQRMNELKIAMGEINEASENISKIIKVIDDIAFQTNILALNAAVEAARAGSYGKGFAVVAEEVRNLAFKSSQAATETAAMIEDSISKVRNGSRLADDTVTALTHIVNQVEKIVDIIDNIAEASNNQEIALTQVNQAIMQVSQVVQTNSATSEECAAASEQLSSQATNLLGTIERFKLKGGSSYGSSAVSSKNYVPVSNNYSGDGDIKLSTGLGKY
ncbi:MAG: methyl-accepting chemotaxis protein [Lachnospiraceae bacterium]|nr:methyl-accepting chemotaxis protein [Lachnospiraceae bacterium]